ncbi:hypothetical protein KTE19_13090 [Lentilactobacillus sp. IMAU92037]|uniref:hypothetical protein n=1 Tax=Lentilactobacillus dabitei TaxID=2831523 RepID=UPI001C2BBECF|nr:hypothetical protein [Lentilactobacillus dabitei]MBV0931603.1 hypothetical protein [Lentilactobacillus dabitei]
MLKKNYSTLALLFASNVLDGGKDIEKVPTQLKNEVKELIKSLEADTETDLLRADGKVIKGVANDLEKNDTQEVAK